MSDRPNIFVLSADALRADHATDLAMEVANRTGGTRFTNAVAPASHTASSVPALATGQFIDERDTGGAPSLLSSFAADGYHTDLVTDNPLAADALSEQSTEKAGGLQNQLDGLLPRRLTRPVERAYFQLVWPAMRRLGLSAPYYRPATRLHEHAMDALSGASEPVFCWLHYMDTHSPYYVPSDYKTDERLDRHRAAAMSRSVALGGAAAANPEDVETIARVYRAACECLRRSVVEFIDLIRKRGLYRPDRDILVVTADHGECFDPERGMLGHLPPASWEALIHVPLIVARPDWPATTVTEQVSLVDLPKMLRPVPGAAAAPETFGREYATTVAGTLTQAGVVRGIRRADGQKLFGRRTEAGTDVIHTQYVAGDPAAETVIEQEQRGGLLDADVPDELVERAASRGGLIGDNALLSEVNESHLRDLGYLE